MGRRQKKKPRKLKNPNQNYQAKLNKTDEVDTDVDVERLSDDENASHIQSSSPQKEPSHAELSQDGAWGGAEDGAWGGVSDDAHGGTDDDAFPFVSDGMILDMQMLRAAGLPSPPMTRTHHKLVAVTQGKNYTELILVRSESTTPPNELDDVDVVAHAPVPMPVPAEMQAPIPADPNHIELERSELDRSFEEIPGNI